MAKKKEAAVSELGAGSDFGNSSLFAYLGTKDRLEGTDRGDRFGINTIHNQQLETVQLAKFYQGGLHGFMENESTSYGKGRTLSSKSHAIAHQRQCGRGGRPQ